MVAHIAADGKMVKHTATESAPDPKVKELIADLGISVSKYPESILGRGV